MTPTRQYETGLEAGRLMRQLHALEPQQSNGEWWTFYEAKMKRRLNALYDLSEPIIKQDLLVSFIEQNIDLVRDRPLAFQHGDFHVGNMLINDNGIALIDFDRSSMADPYDEFKPFVWNVQISPWFESGMVNGYFNDDIPSDFFPILALYAAESLISHIPWAMKYGETELHVAHQVAKDVLTWYDDFKRVIPRWYHAKPPKNEEE
jgi:aminoglycoside phosphotransferase (APT) family kinase protein